MRVRGHRIQARGARPDRFGKTGVVVAGDQHPRPAECRHAVEEPVDGLVGDALCVEHIARHQHGVDALRKGQLCQPLDHGKPGTGQQRCVVSVKLAVLLANLPVGCVQQLDQGLSFSEISRPV